MTSTIVIRCLSSSSTSSIFIVVTGSMAIENSSRQRISGRCDSARAIVSRCCCPPESLVASRLQAVLHLVPQRGLAQALLDQRVEFGAVMEAGHPRRKRHVVVDRQRQADRQRQDHADPAPQIVDILHLERRPARR